MSDNNEETEKGGVSSVDNKDNINNNSNNNNTNNEGSSNGKEESNEFSFGGGPVATNEGDETSKQLIYELLVRVGSDPNISNEDLVAKQFVAMSDAIASDVEDGIGEFIADHFVSCVEAFPMKTSVYGSLYAMVNIEDPEFCEVIFNSIINFPCYIL